jgi:hypothetical protein
MKELVRIIDDQYNDEDLQPTMKKRVLMNKKNNLKKRFESMESMYLRKKNDYNHILFKKLMHFYEKRN